MATMSDFDDDSMPGFEPGRDGDQKVEQFLSDTIPTIEPSASLRAAAQRLVDAEVGLLVVGRVDAVQGVVSERDIVRCVASGIDLDATTVEAVESEDLKWATRSSTVAEVVEEMMEHYLRHVLIAGDDGELVGVTSMRDLMTAYLD